MLELLKPSAGLHDQEYDVVYGDDISGDNCAVVLKHTEVSLPAVNVPYILENAGSTVISVDLVVPLPQPDEPDTLTL